MLAGAILGFLVTLTSVGAGALGVVMLVYLYPVRMIPARLVGTDIVHAIPLTILAGTGHLLMGNVSLGLLGNLLLGSVPGVVVGSAGHKVPDAAAWRDRGRAQPRRSQARPLSHRGFFERHGTGPARRPPLLKCPRVRRVRPQLKQSCAARPIGFLPHAQGVLDDEALPPRLPTPAAR